MPREQHIRVECNTHEHVQAHSWSQETQQLEQAKTHVSPCSDDRARRERPRACAAAHQQQENCCSHRERTVWPFLVPHLRHRINPCKSNDDKCNASTWQLKTEALAGGVNKSEKKASECLRPKSWHSTMQLQLVLQASLVKSAKGRLRSPQLCSMRHSSYNNVSGDHNHNTTGAAQAASSTRNGRKSSALGFSHVFALKSALEDGDVVKLAQEVLAAIALDCTTSNEMTVSDGEAAETWLKQRTAGSANVEALGLHVDLN
jgi:hypothetical protein